MSVLPVTCILWYYCNIIIELFIDLLLVYYGLVFDIKSFEPLGVDQKVHPSEESKQNDKASDDLTKQDSPLSEVNSVCSFSNNTNRHMNNTNDN